MRNAQITVATIYHRSIAPLARSSPVGGAGRINSHRGHTLRYTCTMSHEKSGRAYPRYYEGVQRRNNHALVQEALARSGWRVLSSTGSSTAPLFLGVESSTSDRLALCVYAFTANHRETKNRPADEHRLQVRYGDVNDRSWREQCHPVAFDPLGADVTLVLGVHAEADLLIGLDPLVYDPLPIGISIEWKQDEVDAAGATGWHVWERDNISGSRRELPRTNLGVETMIALSPERLGDYIRLERDAQTLQLDPPLRFRRATAMSEPGSPAGLHTLEREFDLPFEDILDLIRERPRLGVAVRGGVAERHLERTLERDRNVVSVDLDESDGPPDVVARMVDGQTVSVECKNASPSTYADGTPKVETQKTRASKGDPKSRLYDPGQFDVLAACMFGPWERWEFRYKRSADLTRHQEHGDRLAPIQRIDDSWSTSLADAAS